CPRGLSSLFAIASVTGARRRMHSSSPFVMAGLIRNACPAARNPHRFFLLERQRQSVGPADGCAPHRLQTHWGPYRTSDQEEIMTTQVNTVVVGGGQAGLSVSHYLTQHPVEHVVLEQADQPGDAWRSHRWDSFTLNTPRWQSRVPGALYGEDDSDGFMPKQEVVAHLEALASRLPVRTRARVASISRDTRGDYVVALDGGETIKARNVVMATGLYQTPKI